LAVLIKVAIIYNHWLTVKIKPPVNI